MLVLYLLSEREYYIGELTAVMREKSHRILNIVFPYAAIYRLLDEGFIQEVKSGSPLTVAVGSIIRSLTPVEITCRSS